MRNVACQFATGPLLQLRCGSAAYFGRPTSLCPPFIFIIPHLNVIFAKPTSKPLRRFAALGDFLCLMLGVAAIKAPNFDFAGCLLGARGCRSFPASGTSGSGASRKRWCSRHCARHAGVLVANSMEWEVGLDFGTFFEKRSPF